MAQLPSFLPALFEAFGNQSADVRKVNSWHTIIMVLLQYVIDARITSSVYIHLDNVSDIRRLC